MRSFPVPYDWITSSRGDAPVMVCIHGFLETAAIWDVLPPGTWNGHRAVSLPLPAHPPWQIPKGALDELLTGDALIDAYAECVRHISRGQPVRLVGHSTGAMVVVELALRHPDLISDGLIIAPLFSGSIKARSLLGRFLKLPFAGTAAFGWLLRRWLGSHSSFETGLALVMDDAAVPAPDLRQMRDDLKKTSPAGLYRFGQWIGDHDLGPSLQDLHVPIQAVICTEDPVIDVSHQMALVQSAPMVQGVLVKAGHLPQYERPDLFLPIFFAWRETAPF